MYNESQTSTINIIYDCKSESLSLCMKSVCIVRLSKIALEPSLCLCLYWNHFSSILRLMVLHLIRPAAAYLCGYLGMVSADILHWSGSLIGYRQKPGAQCHMNVALLQWFSQWWEWQSLAAVTLKTSYKFIRVPLQFWCMYVTASW